MPHRLLRLFWAVALLASFAGAGWAADYAQGGYADRTSVVQGGTIGFHIATSGSPFNLTIVNLARPQEVLATVSGLTSAPDDCTGKWETGCGWPVTTQFTVPADWPSGFYAAKFPTGDGLQHIIFVVRAASPGSSSPIVLISTTHTYLAYNRFGGKSLYDSLSTNGVRAHVVSYERPYSDNEGLGRFPLWEQQFVQWMRNEGRAFEVITDEDLEDPSILGNYEVAMLVGHSEYWTLQARQHLEAFRNGGGHIAIFAGNTMWWQVRFNGATRRMTGYKSAALDPLTGTQDDVVTVNFYDDPVYNPENLITGASFRHGGYANIAGAGSTNPLPDSQRTPYTVVAPASWVFDGTGVTMGQQIAQAAGGIEVDGVTFNKDASGSYTVDGADGTPFNFEILATLPADEGYGVIGLYTHPNGAAVFNAATRDWSHALAAADPVAQQMTRNVLDRFATGLPLPYLPRTTPWQTEDLFNIPSPDGPLEGVLPNWRGDLQAALLSGRCAHEGSLGLDLKGTQWTQVERTLTYDGSSLSALDVELYVNPDLLTQTPSWGLPLLELGSRASGTLVTFATLELLKEGATRSLRLVLLRADGSTSASTSWVVLPSGWTKVMLAWQSPGTVEFRLGNDTPVQATNPEAGQGIDALLLNFPGTTFDSRGALCVDELRTAIGAGACDPAAITTQPQSTTIPSGTSTTLSVTTTGTEPLAYQWYAGTSPIDGATASSVTVSPTSTTSYFVRVTNTCGSADSETATVTVCNLPVITAQPQSVTIANGTSTTLSVTATDATSYQWYAGGSILPGATSSSVTVSPTSTTSYFVRVGNACGSIDSDTAIVTICNLPAITAQPQSVTIANGTSTTLTVTATGATSYQWYVAGSPISGATASSVTVSPASTTTYFVRVTNTCGSIDSDSATVTVCNLPTITTHPTSRTIQAGTSTTLTVAATNATSYQWYAGASPIGGATSTSLTVAPSTTTSYSVRVSNACGTVTSNTATVTVTAPPAAGPVAWQKSGDFDGDGDADLFWHNPSTRENVLWLMNGVTRTSVVLPACDPGWRPAAIGDWNADGRADLFFLHTSGQTAIWWMNGGTVAGRQLTPVASSALQLEGSGDFNGDGRDDILWRNTSSTATSIWFGAITSAPSASAAMSHEVAGVADFNGDGRDDVMFHNRSNLSNTLWLMNGTAVAVYPLLPSTEATWEVAATGDVTGDGKSDIFWWNTATRQTAVWFMNGGTRTGASVSRTQSTAFRPRAAGDYNRDGRLDIFWRDPAGPNELWLMTGAAATVVGLPPFVGSSWNPGAAQ